MLKRCRLAEFLGLSALCVLDARGSCGSAGPVRAAAERADRRVGSKNWTGDWDGLPGPRGHCLDRCSKRQVVCLLAADRKSGQARTFAGRRCRGVFRGCRYRCEAPPGGPPLYPPPGLRR